MKRSRLWNQEFTVKVPVISDGKVVRTVGCALQRPQKIPRLSITIHFHSKFRLSETYARTTPARAIEEKKGENIASSNKEHASTKSEEKGKDKVSSENCGLDFSALVDPVDKYLSAVLEVVPDVQPDYAGTLLFNSAPTAGSEAVDEVVRFLLQNPYPKIEDKGGAEKERAKFTSTHYSCKDRLFMGGRFYTSIALVSISFVQFLPFFSLGSVFYRSSFRTIFLRFHVITLNVFLAKTTTFTHQHFLL